MEYSYIGVQTLYLATYYDPIYWNTACLRVDAGLEEDDSSRYDKIAKAICDIVYKGIEVSLVDINKSQYLFEPDIENNKILFGMKAVNGVGGEIIQEIIKNRPYKSWQDAVNKLSLSKTVTISLIKSGAFDQFGDREDIMREYLWSVTDIKKRITLQNFNGLMENNLIPDELNFEKRLFVYNKALKANCKYYDDFIIAENYYDFFEEFFDLDLLEVKDNLTVISQKTWSKLYTKSMEGAKKYFKENQEDILNNYNNLLFEEIWQKYANDDISHWEIQTVGFYYHDHELKNINMFKYDISEFKSLREQPIVDYTFKRNGIDIPIFKTNRIMGTVIAKNDIKSIVSILTVDSGVVDVRFTKDYYAKYNRRISEAQEDGTKKVKENGWFSRGNMIVVQGIRKGDIFQAKKYKNSPGHQLYKIEEINGENIRMTNLRWGEERYE